MTKTTVPQQVGQRGVTFDTEPDWMKKARTVPLTSTYDSRQAPEPAKRPT